MTHKIDLRDVQGNIVRAYGRFGYPHARHLFFHFATPQAGRAALAFLTPLVTNAVTWTASDRDPETMAPRVTMNLGLTWRGLQALGLPTRSLTDLPDEFIDGMARRAPILSDCGASDPANWDKIWRDSVADPSKAVHLWVALNARMDPATGGPVSQLADRLHYLRDLPRNFGGLVLLSGHGAEGLDNQPGALNIVDAPDGGKAVLPLEHFGFADGISDPIFAGQADRSIDASVIVGRGRFSSRDGWSALAPGEFILGHVDESQETSRTGQPADLMRNGSFAVFRKLEQDVTAFDDYIAAQAEVFAKSQGVPLDEAAITLKAKIVGRWPNGAPLVTVPTYADMLRFGAEWADVQNIYARKGPRSKSDQQRLAAWRRALNDFTFREDRDGLSCPLGAHIRRGNPRDMLDPLIESPSARHRTGAALTNRRRILRRGIPYGPFGDSGAERGLLFIAICADLQRQYEFVQQQWMNHGMDMQAGNSGCPLIGRREAEAADVPAFTLPQKAGTGKPPHFLPAMPDFIRTKGGDYFFLPSLTALRNLSIGAFDPT
jgi:Dyp-type peroxidase family